MTQSKIINLATADLDNLFPVASSSEIALDTLIRLNLETSQETSMRRAYMNRKALLDRYKDIDAAQEDYLDRFAETGHY